MWIQHYNIPEVDIVYFDVEGRRDGLLSGVYIDFLFLSFKQVLYAGQKGKFM